MATARSRTPTQNPGRSLRRINGNRRRGVGRNAAFGVLDRGRFVRHWLQATAAGLTMLVGGGALAQSSGKQQTWSVTLSGTIQSTISVSVGGSVDGTTGAGTTVTGSGVAGRIDFGTASVFSHVINGANYRIPGKGMYLVATVRVGTLFSGLGGGRAALDVQRANPCGGVLDVPCEAGRLLFARQAQHIPNREVSWPEWTSYPDPRYGATVFDVPDASYVPGAGNLDDRMENGESIDHQLAVWVPDDAEAGAFTTVVKYTATRL